MLRLVKKVLNSYTMRERQRSSEFTPQELHLLYNGTPLVSWSDIPEHIKEAVQNKTMTVAEAIIALDQYCGKPVLLTSDAYNRLHALGDT